MTNETTGDVAPDVFEAMGTARAMRWLRSDPVPPPLIDRVLWAATRASSPNNCQPWNFVVVEDQEVRRSIGEFLAPMASPQPPPADMDPTQRRTVAGAMNLIGGLAEVPVIIFVCGANVYPANAPDISMMYSAVYAAAQNMVVAARALGLGAAFTTLHRLAEPQIRELLGIPDEHTLAVTVPLGWPARTFGPVTRIPVADVVHRDRW